MKSAKHRSIKKTTAKLLFAGVLSFGIMGFTSATFAQGPPTPPGGPPPPGELLKKINPFKKNKSKSTNSALNLPAPGTPPAGAPGNPPKLGNPPAPGNGPGAPPTPPNPIELIKKIKLPKPPAHPGT
ncbi:MAG: hypothetical protein V4619_04195 [Bacteroidota bacterium]